MCILISIIKPIRYRLVNSVANLAMILFKFFVYECEGNFYICISFIRSLKINLLRKRCARLTTWTY